MDHFKTILKSSREDDRIKVLDFLGNASTISQNHAAEILPLLENSLLDPDTQIRYFARKVRSHFQECFPALFTPEGKHDQAAETSQEGALPLREILLRKMKLGSRYVSFEAIERLTESQDIALADPLLEFLKSESDPFKVSYLVKRITRIPDPRIPAMVEGFLANSDPRIVANAVEGLTDLDLPHLRERFERMAGSPDNRVRANAVRALHKFDPAKAEEHVKAMLESSSIALQDSGVFLLDVLRPPHLNQLLEIAGSSRFTTIRLKALEVPKRPSVKMAAIDPARVGRPYEFIGLTGSLFLAAAVILAGNFLPKPFVIMVFLVVATSQTLLAPTRRTVLNKLLVSSALIACLAWKDNRILSLLGLLAIWIPGQRTPHDEVNSLPRLIAISFAAISFMAFNHIQGAQGKILELVFRFSDPAQFKEPVLEALQRQDRFVQVHFTLIFLYSFFLLNFHRWFKPDGSDRPYGRKLIIAYTVGVMLVVVVNLFHVWGISFVLLLQGLANPFKMFRFLPH